MKHPTSGNVVLVAPWANLFDAPGDSIIARTGCSQMSAIYVRQIDRSDYATILTPAGIFATNFINICMLDHDPWWS